VLTAGRVKCVSWLAASLSKHRLVIRAPASPSFLRALLPTQLLAHLGTRIPAVPRLGILQIPWYLDNSLREPLQCVVLTKQDEDEGDLGAGHHCILVVIVSR